MKTLLLTFVLALSFTHFAFADNSESAVLEDCAASFESNSRDAGKTNSSKTDDSKKDVSTSISK